MPKCLRDTGIRQAWRPRAERPSRVLSSRRSESSPPPLPLLPVTTPIMKSFSVASQLLLAAGVSANFARNRYGGMKLGPINEFAILDAENTTGWGFFDQLIDHANPSLGTFKQRYWYNTQFWKGPGSPIILVNPGEQAGDGFNVTFTQSSRITGRFAQATGGAVVIMEHRYWGQSSPFDLLSVENLTYLTLENSIKDNSYFANNWKAPFDESGRSSAKEAPWVYTGGSYPGALSGWIANKDPGTFWAYYGTSGVVQAIGNFWQYFVPVLEATPKNCSTDLNNVINYVDNILLHGNVTEKNQLKAQFKLDGLEDADFGAAIENGPWTFQSGQFFSESISGFNPYFQFCDYVENVWPGSTNKVPDAQGVGLQKALSGYAKWFTEASLPGFCESFGYFQGEFNTECFQSLNASNPIYHDLTLHNTINRQWNWMLCNEPFEYWQDGAPQNHTTIVSRLVNKNYWHQQCALMFPGNEYGIAQGKSAASVNEFTGGWFATNTTRLMMTNGEWDPWRDTTYSSKFRPGGPLQSTDSFPVRFITHGTHCSDLYGENWDVNPDTKAIADDEVAQMKEWVAAYYTTKH
ncbi:serine carboxypeptidase S28-domain-containing protein [Xylaria nigripes]|nr:serine carboxypeptidase S28-domain-containing protein [Xylaria nigripes]